MKTAEIRFNDITYLVHILSESKNGVVTVTYPDGETEQIGKEDWTRYLKNQQEFAEEQQYGSQVKNVK